MLTQKTKEVNNQNVELQLRDVALGYPRNEMGQGDIRIKMEPGPAPEKYDGVEKKGILDMPREKRLMLRKNR